MRGSKCFCVVGLLSVLWFLPPRESYAQQATIRTIPAPPSGVQREAHQGASVAVGEHYAVVGAPEDDIGGEDGGVVKVYSVSTGALLYVLPNPGPTHNNRFGIAVAISGQRLVVGAGLAGKAYVYDLGGPALTTPLVLSPALSSFGQAVAISGSRVVIGAPFSGTLSGSEGTAYVYDLESVTPESPIAILHSPEPSSSAGFGAAVAIDGTRVIIGEPYSDGEGYNVGRVYVYDVAEATPDEPVRTVVNPTPSWADFFGYSVALHGTRLVVGGGNTDEVYVYDLLANAPPTILTNPAAGQFSQFGSRVALSGTRLVVGASGDDSEGVDSGIAYVFNLAAAEAPMATLRHPHPAAGNQAGAAVAIFGNHALIGVPGDDGAALDAGSALLFDLASDAPEILVFHLAAPSPSANDGFGTAVAVSGTWLVVGSPRDQTAQPSGAVYVYDLAGATPTVPMTILPGPDDEPDLFGSVIALSGATLAVGLPSAAPSARVYVYHLDDATPAVADVILDCPPQAADGNFGCSLAWTGTRLVVGARYAEDYRGAVYVFDVSAPDPSQTMVTLIAPPESAYSSQFGAAVAASGSRVVVGAPLETVNGDYGVGGAFVYDLGSSTSPVPMRLSNSYSYVRFFGSSVAIEGDRIAVSVPASSFLSHVLIYQLDTATPSKPIDFLASPCSSLAISGEQLAVGSEGRVDLYDFTGPSFPEPEVTLTEPIPPFWNPSMFGTAVALDGASLLVGAQKNSQTAARKGAAYLFASSSTSPKRGLMWLSPTPLVARGAPLTVTFSGWQDADLPLTYSVRVGNAVVSPDGPTDERMITAPSGATGSHVITGRITDALGNSTEITADFVTVTAHEFWRYTYFGTTINEGDAADTADPDGDGSNFFEFVAGTVPTDPMSRFAVRVEAVPGQTGQKAIIFHPIVAGRTYAVKWKRDLSDPVWNALDDFSTTDRGDVRTVVDLDAGVGANFYIVEITRP